MKGHRGPFVESSAPRRPEVGISGRHQHRYIDRIPKAGAAGELEGDLLGYDAVHYENGRGKMPVREALTRYRSDGRRAVHLHMDTDLFHRVRPLEAHELDGGLKLALN